MGRAIIIVLLVFWGAGAEAWADGDSHRHVDAHEHGTGALNIALDGSSLSVELEVPAHDLVGFEHAPTTPEEVVSVEAAEVSLKEGKLLFGIPEAADCDSVEQNIHSPFASGEASKDSEHAEFSAHYEFECSAPSKLDKWNVQFFDTFPNSSKLNIQAISNHGQTAQHLSPENPILDLSDILH